MKVFLKQKLDSDRPTCTMYFRSTIPDLSKLCKEHCKLFPKARQKQQICTHKHAAHHIGIVTLHVCPLACSGIWPASLAVSKSMQIQYGNDQLIFWFEAKSVPCTVQYSCRRAKQRSDAICSNLHLHLGVAVEVAVLTGAATSEGNKLNKCASHSRMLWTLAATLCSAQIGHAEKGSNCISPRSTYIYLHPAVRLESSQHEGSRDSLIFRLHHYAVWIKGE